LGKETETTERCERSRLVGGKKKRCYGLVAAAKGTDSSCIKGGNNDVLAVRPLEIQKRKGVSELKGDTRSKKSCKRPPPPRGRGKKKKGLRGERPAHPGNTRDAFSQKKKFETERNKKRGGRGVSWVGEKSFHPPKGSVKRKGGNASTEGKFIR